MQWLRYIDQSVNSKYSSLLSSELCIINYIAQKDLINKKNPIW